MKNSLFDRLRKLLKNVPEFVNENGEIKKWIVINKALNNDKELISLLLDDKEVIEKFFVKIKESLIFDQNIFVQFIEQKNYLNDSYTQFKNKVGLTIKNQFLKQRNEIALVWPFKDCVLEGGISHEEDKREEIFFNEILAQDEITQLLEPKVLSNGKSINRQGEKPLITFNRNENGEINDNLIIKGNNLLVLHTLKELYAGKVKLIYIDPPYNTGGNGDTFSYNNNFKRSTWLTFMYNRLKVARELLRKDGVLIIAIDENEQAHLGVMLKEHFQDYDIHCVTIVHNPRGIQGTNFSYTHEYSFFVIPKGKKLIGEKIIQKSEIKYSNLRNWGGESLRSDAKNCFYPIIVNPNTSEIIEFGEVCEDHYHPLKREIMKDERVYIYPIDNDNIERKWRYARQSIDQVKGLLRARKKNGQWDIEIGKNFGQYKTVWIDPKYDANEYGTKIVNKLVKDNKFSFPKSLYNVKDCIHAVVGNDKNAIILDYHAGSGTTAHAVLELNKEDGGNRKFILCEQMEYIETVTVKRVQKVIEQNGKDDFVYIELKKYNQTFIEQIEEAKDTNDLLEIWEQMKAKSFLNYNVDIKKQDEHIEEFKELSLAEQKRHLCEILDKNQLYVNLSSLHDNDFACTEEEKRITQDFYRLRK
jgi:adenine-specific DNA-methyltransferase